MIQKIWFIEKNIQDKKPLAKLTKRKRRRPELIKSEMRKRVL
jgi:hypothetical protein